MKPTPPNLAYARRLVADIEKRIAVGQFDLGKEFPAYKGLKRFGVSKAVALAFEVYADRWLASKGKSSPSTVNGYRKILNAHWRQWFPGRTIASILPSEVEVKMAEATFGRKTHNNVLDAGRQIFEMAERDKAITANPCAGIAFLDLQRKDPDPFSLAEAEQIIAALLERWGPEVADYYEFAFFSGLRPNEHVELRWPDIDLQAGLATISRGMVRKTVKDTKTYNARVLELHSRALAVLQRQRARTYLAGAHVFLNPHTGKPYADEHSQGRYFSATLKKLGLRHRPAKNTRHTYATLLLMAGANPRWAAGQMGHSPQVFQTIYTKWLEKQDAGRELAKVEAYAGSVPGGATEPGSTGQSSGQKGGKGRFEAG